jgi:hypothetical protein
MSRSLTPFIRTFIIPILFLSCGIPVLAQQENEMEEAYQRAEQILSWNLADKVFKASVNPQQIDETHFWYLLNVRNGNQYLLVNVSEHTKEPAFDHDRLADAIEHASGSEADPANLALRNLTFHDQLQFIRFEKERKVWQCSLELYECEIRESVLNPPSQSVVSPDGKKAVLSETGIYGFRILKQVNRPGSPATAKNTTVTAPTIMAGDVRTVLF